METKIIKCTCCGASASKNVKFCEYCGSQIFTDENVSEDIKQENISGETVMIISDIFSIFGRTIVAGKLENLISVGTKIKNERTNEVFNVEKIELYKSIVKKAEKGQHCGLLINADKKSFQKGDKLVF